MEDVTSSSGSELLVLAGVVVLVEAPFVPLLALAVVIFATLGAAVFLAAATLVAVFLTVAAGGGDAGF